MGLCIRQTGSISAFPREGGGGKRQDRQTSLISQPICTPLHGCLLSSSFHLLHRTSCKLEHSSSSRGETLSPLISQIGLHQTLKTRRRDRIGWSCNTHFFRSFFLSFFLSFYSFFLFALRLFPIVLAPPSPRGGSTPLGRTSRGGRVGGRAAVHCGAYHSSVTTQPPRVRFRRETSLPTRGTLR